MPVFSLAVHPGHQFGHQPWRVKRRGGFKDDADLRTVFIEGGDAVRVGLVRPPVARILFAVTQKDLVQLLDVVLVERNVLPRAEHQIHQFSVASHFLFVAGVERLNSQVGEQALHLPVRQLAALDAGRRAYAFDGRHPPQR